MIFSIGFFSKELFKIPHLAIFLQSETQLASFFSQFSKPVTKIAGWGKRPTSLKARTYAKQHGLSYLALEDGFLRSVGLGKESPPLSLVIDDKGIYYDASCESRLEKLISQTLATNQITRANQLVMLWRAGRVSKYNHLREYAGELPGQYVLVVDQTFGDSSVELGLANAESFQTMLDAALAENPEAMILVKTHPDVLAGYKKGYFSVRDLEKQPRVKVFAENVHPVRLIENAKAVYAVTSQMGFEALLWGKPVRCFGMPFYAGWGLTNDALKIPDRRKQHSVSLQQLIHAALIDYPRYIHPERESLCEVEEVLTYIVQQRLERERYPEVIYGLKFSRWKKSILPSFLQGSEIRFVSNIQQVPDNATLAVWGTRFQEIAELEARNIHLLRLEDGFLRSVGLGADLIKPVSWVIDSRGIYYDASRISDLEHILQTTEFSNALIERARNLRKAVVENELTKYNVSKVNNHQTTDFPSSKLQQAKQQGLTIILVTGQVETDASIQLGCSQIKTNLELLKAVKFANPDAYIVYKPHPDVLSGLRKKGQGEDETYQYCDELVANVSMATVLNKVDEVHLLTSLTGFEALLRNKEVVCYGSPFYSGWGLTEDITPLERRTRKLSLDELVAGALILYPRYVSRMTGHFTTPEQALKELLIWRETQDNYLSWKRRLFRLWLRLLAK